MKVSLFITCLSDALYPRVGEAMVRILARYGVQVHFPEAQTCCGQPAFNSGYWEEARTSALTLIHAFADSDYVISPSGSCTGMIHHYYPKLFENDPQLLAKANALREKTYEFTQFLVNVLGVTDLGAVFPHKVTYHPSCHGSRLLGIKQEPLQLMEQVQGLDLVPLPFAEDCCGFGGTFAVKMSDISGAMVTEKADHVLETEAEVLVGLDLGCLMNISGNLRFRGKPVRVMHLAELLYEGMMANEHQ
ncbi:(Fe-S)-binding protein [Brevibacillus nitrificans]|uniref:(Fe-S)-binding protein n=1 Tax=Brevibacillus nitrificans TaxID=651560 RepID=A0A3M8CVX3_9BACL|nr:(Fe-S)-binding protein [Brevibacillus nitrificans]RNB79894.1 (Fe-S)-binding protein [Brevibacillus nitrificans]